MKRSSEQEISSICRIVSEKNALRMKCDRISDSLCDLRPIVRAGHVCPHVSMCVRIDQMFARASFECLQRRAS